MLKLKTFFLTIIVVVFLSNLAVYSQSSNVKWKRKAAGKTDLQLFHASAAINLPTAETMQKGDLEFEISHRFRPTTGSGIDGLYGFDGPVTMRIALGYAPTNKSVITVGRSNIDDNIDLWLKYKLLQFRNADFPILVAVRAGGAWNTQLPFPVTDRDKTNKRNFQGFGQLVINGLFAKKLGIGIVSSYLYNSDIRFSTKTKDTFTLGTYLQYYVSPLWSMIVEWNPKISGYLNQYNPLSFGVELETGGHFFKVFLTNSFALNSTQYLAGADLPVERNDWRIGFGITRLIKFAK